MNIDDITDEEMDEFFEKFKKIDTVLKTQYTPTIDLYSKNPYKATIKFHGETVEESEKRIMQELRKIKIKSIIK